MAIEHEKIAYRDEVLAQGETVVPDLYQGVSKSRITDVLEKLALYSDDRRDAVFAMLCDEDSWITSAAKNGFMFHDGATCAQVGTHVKILQRGENIKVDREQVRKRCMVPLFSIGAVDKVLYESKLKSFVDGHPKANASYSSYRLSDSFKSVLFCNEVDLEDELNAWVSSDERVERRAFQAKVSTAKLDNQNKHSVLIEAIHKEYAPRFLPGFELVYIDNGNGSRITDAEKEILLSAGIVFERNDRLPDVLFFNPKLDALWVVDAVTTDGEVDYARQQDFIAFAKRNGKKKIGFTTAYMTWKKAASRQAEMQNLAESSYLWVLEDASKNILIQQEKKLGQLVEL
ncbi:hypothetical protein EM59_016410 [Vibrio parahaemolyticus]|uniref:BsuBI/PstI family type II restriction endonuclease n=1 Tax=Vibrio parahaemolyticus TaxID=670 RepID=UPI0004DAED65|nr:BsuBI/PstI family type II restriction endonuclease [Vibrio parahaemolyticus]EGQ7650912.1 hypothetical protein [Vibrio parahaemolyticus]EGQ9979464.1 hypothetical protein [Vibrio parahaemolyticus]EJG1824794.1 hypothetical protein [Vibrio parahaemolyticus]ELB2744103.1 hypothetical protein [Vibrio parahaemolyticus]ELC9528602.1 hypothetical protein [Vibrio parahaemolyticus]